MWGNDKDGIRTVEQLISRLEHIEQSEISCDIRANVRAELKRIKRNVSAILEFTSYSETLNWSKDAELASAIVVLRRECLSVNASVSRLLLLHSLRAEAWTDYSSRIAEQYGRLSEAAQQMCLIAAPMRVQELATSL